MRADALTGGFAAPPIDAAHGFRAALDAMARPGTVHTVSGAAPPAPMSVAAGVLALVLCDPDVPVWLAPRLVEAGLGEWFAFHTGAPLVGPEDATFAFGTWEEAAGQPWRIGTSEFPDRSATLIVEVPELGMAHRLTGPGIADTARLTVPDPVWSARNRALFPLGLDLFLTAGDQLAALPRSTIVEV